ncbi:putative bifunctional diguanylate cyclase/phosphodiesterase [Erwinia sp. AnSW2-5]|uniref:putative bifunctional diguanylate cyclase/phosphodiesterase n=1 Tax=Erwinia sp. AnSW2-5 TaxID=3367692 RepID=UPI0038588D83
MKSPNDEHLEYICRMAFLTGLVVTVGWLAVFVVLKEWTVVISLLTLGGAAFFSWRIAMRGNFSTGLMLAQLVHMAYAIIYCLLCDVPEPGIPRTTHLYLLTIALVGYINYQRRRTRVQMAMIVACLLSFMVFSSADLVFPFANPLPRPWRATISMANAILATVILCGGIVAMHADFSRRSEKIRAIQHALYNNELVLFYQPLLNASGQINGAEALLRWQIPGKGMVPPSEFIPDAQLAGLMPAIGDWVIVSAFRELAQWQKNPATAHLTLSINITVDHLMKPDFVANLMHQAQATQVSPSQVKLELTESVFATDIETVVAKMHTLAAAGFRFSLDDFGTGFSSLSYLRRLPLEQIKIDRSFISGATEGPKGAVIAMNIARMGLELKLEVLAEGIETAEQWKVMQEFGCTAFQGFYFSRPLSIRDFRAFTSQNRAAAASA